MDTEVQALLQVIQPIDGQPTEVVELPPPICGPGQILIANRASVISAGTERSTVALAQSSLVDKARQRPDHVRRVMEKVRQEGIASTIRQVQAKLAQPMPMGYSSAGTVVEVGRNVREFRVGDRVASNGPHAGIVAVGKHLAAHVPEEVPFEHAAYAVVGSIALQGIRLAGVGLGDFVAVIGLGLVGQLAVGLLRAAGCRVVATDIDPGKYELALQMGAESVGSEQKMRDILRTGADAVLITAATSSNGPLELAAEIARDRAKIVAVGAVGMNVPRREFYHKELELIVSRSYGPGRYDPDYEERGHDYPVGYVPWTEQRNIQGVLDLMAAGRLTVDALTTHRYAIEDATGAYQMIDQGSEPFVGIILNYPADLPQRPETRRPVMARPKGPAGPGVSVVGTGSFASAVLIPELTRRGDFVPRGLVSARGISARALTRRHRFEYISTELDEVLADEETSTVLLATRHSLHVPQGLSVLRAGRNLLVEKPLAVSTDQLDEWIEGVAALGADCPVWMVGFNRRFSPGARILRESLAETRDVKAVTIRFNAGSIPADHWVHDPEVGGGRIVGEACHAIDLATYLVGALPIRIYAEAISPRYAGLGLEDNVAMQIRFAEGSTASILYTSAGDRSAGKERVEVFSGGMTGILDDFRRVEIRRHGRLVRRQRWWWSQEKGYAEELSAFRKGIDEGRFPIPPDEMIAVTAASLRALQSLRMETPLDVEVPNL